MPIAIGVYNSHTHAYSPAIRLGLHWSIVFLIAKNPLTPESIGDRNSIYGSISS